MLAPFNIGLILMTIVIWFIAYRIGYYNTGNFNMFLVLQGYIQQLSLTAIGIGMILGFMHPGQLYKKLTMIASISYLLSLLATMFSRTMLNSFLIFNIIQDFAVQPASIFCFLLILKYILQITANVNAQSQK
jgi:hypothetical protein